MSVYGHLRMTLSEDGTQTLQNLEGLKLRAYRDSVGKWTIGYGHISTAHEGMVISKVEALRLLKEYDLPKYIGAVNEHVKVALTQRQFDSLVIFAYNVGIEGFRTSTLLRLINQKEYEEASEQFLRWIYGNGKVIEGLRNRRIVERDLWNKGLFNERPA